MSRITKLFRQTKGDMIDGKTDLQTKLIDKYIAFNGGYIESVLSDSFGSVSV